MCDVYKTGIGSERFQGLISFSKMVFRFVDLLMGMAAKDTTPLQMGILLKLAELGQQPISSVAEIMKIAKPNMTTLVDELCEKGFIKRSPSEKDRRVINIELTAEGKEYLSKTTENLEKAYDKLLSVLTDEEKVEFNYMYTQLLKMGAIILEAHSMESKEGFCPFKGELTDNEDIKRDA